MERDSSLCCLAIKKAGKFRPVFRAAVGEHGRSLYRHIKRRMEQNPKNRQPPKSVCYSFENVRDALLKRRSWIWQIVEGNTSS